MTPQDIDRVLSQTLADFRLTSSEKRALGALLGQEKPDDQQLALFRSRAFALAREAVLSPQAQQVLEWLEEVIKLALPQGAAAATAAPATGGGAFSEAHFSPYENCVGCIIDLFRKTKASADICVFTITDDRITNALLDAHKRGVTVRVITDNDKALDLGSDIDRISSAGVPVRLDKTPAHMHHKYAIFDGATLLNGSFNWTRGASEVNNENIIVTRDPAMIAAFRKNFERLWQQFGA